METMKIIPGKEQEYADYVEINSHDGYSKVVIDYTERWANLMEEKVADGCEIPSIADETSHTTDTDGITGFMYGCAVSALAHFWEHGETLRRWHNHECQIGTEGDDANENGGVLNPAIINIGERTLNS
jgi:hypothetical protein